MQILTGVHQIKTPAPGSTSWQTNVYVMEGSDGHILVDSGWDSQESLWALQEGIKAANLKLRDIKKVVITHIHPDHYGLSTKIKQICGAQVAIHRIDAGFIFPRYKDFDDLIKNSEELLRQNGAPEDVLTQLKEASLWMNKYVTPDLPEVELEEGSARPEVPLWLKDHVLFEVPLTDNRFSNTNLGDVDYVKEIYQKLIGEKNDEAKKL